MRTALVTAASAFLALVAGAGILGACTGEDPAAVITNDKDASDDGRGDLGAACYPNGTCNADLECRDGICTTRGASDGGTTLDGGDAGSEPTCNIAPVGKGPACPTNGNAVASCDTGEECCSLFDTVRCEGSCAPYVQANDTTYVCTAPSHCGSGSSCCLVDATFTQSDVGCTGTTIATIKASSCQSNCGALPQFCTVTPDCPNGQLCKAAAVNMGGTIVQLGVCR